MKQPEGKYAWTVKVGEKGQIVIPKEARDVFSIHPGDTILLLGDVNQGIAIVNNSQFMQLTQFAEAIFRAQGKAEDTPEETN